MDATDSIDDPGFCRFGYVMQLIVAAINPRGTSGARVAAVLFEFQPYTTARYLFHLDDQCNSTVSVNIPRVVFEYYGVKHRGLKREDLTYPNVRATTTKPYSALKLAANGMRSTGRPTSTITLTDGKSHQSVSSQIEILKTLSDPLIAAGIGPDTNVPFLLKLASNSSTVVYEPDKDQVLNLGKRIINTMKATGALCDDEGIYCMIIS